MEGMGLMLRSKAGGPSAHSKASAAFAEMLEKYSDVIEKDECSITEWSPNEVSLMILYQEYKGDLTSEFTEIWEKHGL